MKKALTVLLLAFPAIGLARELVDPAGARVTISDHPTRIVALAPSLGELASDFLGDEIGRIVGVSEATDYPPGLKQMPSVGPYTHVNLEKIVALKPDLILATHDGNSKDQVLRLRELGLPVVVIKTETFGEISESMKFVGTALGYENQGLMLSRQFEEGLGRIRARAAERRRKGLVKRVLLQLGDRPLIVVGKKSFLNEELEAIGAENVYGSLDVRYPRPSTEDATQKNPDVIVILSFGGDLTPFQEAARHWEQFGKMKAVQRRAIRVLHSDEILRPTLRLLEGISILERTVYGS